MHSSMKLRQQAENELINAVTRKVKNLFFLQNFFGFKDLVPPQLLGNFWAIEVRPRRLKPKCFMDFCSQPRLALKCACDKPRFLDGSVAFAWSTSVVTGRAAAHDVRTKLANAIFISCSRPSRDPVNAILVAAHANILSCCVLQ